MYDIVSREKLENKINEIFSYISKYKIEIPEESCLVLEFRQTMGGRYGYYFVNHVEQRLFWLDEFNGMDFLFEIKVKYSPTHIGESFITVLCMNYFINIEESNRSRNEIQLLVGPTLQLNTNMIQFFIT